MNYAIGRLKVKLKHGKLSNFENWNIQSLENGDTEYRFLKLGGSSLKVPKVLKRPSREIYISVFRCAI